MGSIKHDRSDILIVGAGIFGTSTAYHLSQCHPDPSRITVLDRAPYPSPSAASSDINKIVRADYSSAFYMDLAYEAMDAWNSWELLRPFYHRTGWIMIDERDSDLAERIRRNFRSSGRPDESADISLAEIRTRWDGILDGVDATGFKDTAYLNPTAGWADASLATEAMMRAAVARGVRYEVGEVEKLLVSSSSSSLSSSSPPPPPPSTPSAACKRLEGVRTKEGKLYSSDKILLATGAWTPQLMSRLEDEMGIPDEGTNRAVAQMTAAGVCVASFELSPDEAAHYGKMPILIYGSQGEVMPPNRDGLFKFTNANTFTNFEGPSSPSSPSPSRSLSSHPPPPSSSPSSPPPHPRATRISIPSSQAQTEVPDKLKAQSIEIIKARIPQILADGRRAPDAWRLCWDAISPDQNQLITRHPDPRLSNLHLAAAGSFHSWKFLPTIGRYVVNVLNGVSNGAEKDEAWRWKTGWSGRGAHEKTIPKVDLRDF